MKLDRAVIKAQAKELIRGRLWTLFLIVFVVTLLTGSANYITNINNFNNENPFKKFSSQAPNINNFGELEDYFDDLDDYMEDNAPNKNSIIKSTIFSNLLRLAFIANLALSPLQILLCGVFLLLIRGNALELYDEFSYVFKNTFDKNYFNKLLLTVLKMLFTFLWSLLLIFPGIIYGYKVYFAEYIQADYPELSWKDCLSVSKKMTDGHKGELFVFDLSFIPWFLLTAITLGIASVYVAPYYQTAKALYYENFKQRALATGELNQTDFMTEMQKYTQFVNQNPQANAYYQPIQKQPLSGSYTPYYAPQNTAYPVQNTAPTYGEQQANYYQPAPPINEYPQQGNNNETF